MKDTADKLLNSQQDAIDIEKLRAVVSRNKWWLVGIFLAFNGAAYLATRWTKDVFESSSDLKLDVRRDASELGMKDFVQDPNRDLIAGEIEQIKSSLFLNKIIDSLNLTVGYFSQGNVLKNELYKQAPFRVKLIKTGRELQDIPIYFFPVDVRSFRLNVGGKGEEISANYGAPLSIADSDLVIYNIDQITEKDGNDYYFIIQSRERLVGYLAKNSRVEPLNFEANTIRISFKDYNSQKASDIVNKIDSSYISYSNEQKNLANKQKIEWLNNQLSQLEKKMESFESYFEEFTLTNKSSDASADMKRTINLINRYDSQRYSLNKKIIEIEVVIDGLVSEKKRSYTFQYPFLPDYINKRLEALSTLMQERDRLAMAYNENTLAVRQKEKDLTLLKDQVFSQLASLKEDWMKNLSNIVIEKQKVEKEFLSMPDKATKFSKNQRNYNLITEFYLSMMQSKAQFEIAKAGSIPDFKILSAASRPKTPITRRELLYHGIGFASSLAFGFFFIGFAYILDDKVTSLREIDQVLDVPVLGIIPSTRYPTDGILVQDNPRSMASEAIRSLRTNLDFFTSGGTKKIVTISSSISGEGKSFLAKNLGGVIAMSNKKVALLDLDMRKAKLTGTGSDQLLAKGLSTVLINKNSWRECVQKTSIENLDFIPSGPLPPNPSELLVNGEFTKLIDEMQQEYDFLLLDTPPAGLVTDAIMAMRKSDLSIFVIRANYSKKDFLRNIDRIMTVNKLSNVAIVLNALPQSDKLYGYGYYEDYSDRRKWWNFFKR
ncbi:MAG TPA: polysaccharide biosynthesis tyrosine autokinase [Cyclobacteriaceae bacterium]|nr:polysaccharide biosynthesis tyrosine autokinase [Cyclobacteriaceae bacterium]